VGAWLFADTYHRWHRADDADRPIRFAHFGSYEDFELWRDVIAEFERDHGGVRVKQEYVVGFDGRYHAKLNQQFMSGSEPDVALVQLGPFLSMADRFADLSDLRDADGADAFDATAMRAFHVDARQPALPIGGGPLLIYLNERCVARAQEDGQLSPGVPAYDWTTEEFVRFAKALTKDFDRDGVIDQYGFWLPRWVYYLPFSWSMESRFSQGTPPRWAFTDRAAIEALAFYQRLALKDAVCPRAADVPQLFQDTGFLTGRVAMCVNGPWFEPFLAKTKLAKSYRVLPIPRGAAGRATRVTWDGVGVSRRLSGRRAELARAFVVFLRSPSVQDRIGQTGKAIPARVSSWDAYRAAGSSRRRFLEAMRYARLQPRVARFDELDRAINRRLEMLIDPAEPITPKRCMIELRDDPAIREMFRAERHPQKQP